MQKPPFINNQRLLLLREDAPQPQNFFDPDAFRSARLADQERGDGRTHADPRKKYWREVNRRWLFFESGIQRLCISTDGGVGKSTLLRWAEQEWGQRRRNELAMYIEFHRLPKRGDAQQYLLTTSSKGLLVHLLQAGGNGDLAPEAADRLLRRLMAHGRLTLLIDGLDQTRSYEGGIQNPRVEGLVEFLENEGAACRLVIAGRPHAVHRYWSDLFTKGEWRFAQLDHFTAAQQEAYLGAKVYSRLKNMDVEILSVPRALEAIRQLKSSQLDDLRTASDVYWECTKTMLARTPLIDQHPKR